MLQFFGYGKCSTCRRARQWLDEHHLAYQFIDITKQPPSKQQLGGLMTDAGYELKALFNRSGQRYRQMNMKDRLPTLSQNKAIDLLASDGMLCKRPIVIGDQRGTVGFNPETFTRIWKA